jgi:hypothetical protein
LRCESVIHSSALERRSVASGTQFAIGSHRKERIRHEHCQTQYLRVRPTDGQIGGASITVAAMQAQRARGRRIIAGETAVARIVADYLSSLQNTAVALLGGNQGKCWGKYMLVTRGETSRMNGKVSEFRSPVNCEFPFCTRIRTEASAEDNNKPLSLTPRPLIFLHLLQRKSICGFEPVSDECNDDIQQFP